MKTQLKDFPYESQQTIEKFLSCFETMPNKLKGTETIFSSLSWGEFVTWVLEIAKLENNPTKKNIIDVTTNVNMSLNVMTSQDIKDSILILKTELKRRKLEHIKSLPNKPDKIYLIRHKEIRSIHGCFYDKTKAEKYIFNNTNLFFVEEFRVE